MAAPRARPRRRLRGRARGPGARRFARVTVDELRAGLPATGVRTAGASFGVAVERAGASPRRRWYDGCGRPLAEPPPPPLAAPRRRDGWVELGPLDSGRPRCVWHRVRIDGELPARSWLAVEVATVEDAGASPHADDWQRVENAPLDFLIAQPPGRYLWLRLRLRGDGHVSPRLRRIRVDFPRATAAEHLPAVFRDRAEGGDFLDAFLSLFDATIGDLDDAIARFPALLDPAVTPAAALPWLASLLDLGLDPAWPEDRRRALIAALPELYRRRGTPEGLRRAVELTFGVTPAIEELGAVPPFGALGGVRVGTVRLFGRGRARARLGGSRLGQTRLDSYGDPDGDARAALAYRIRVQVPAIAGVAGPQGRARLARLVDAQKPAHVAATIRVGAAVPLVGVGAAVGIDTALRALPAPVLGGADGNVRLRRTTILWPGARRVGATLSVGRAAAVGVHTLLR
ncbi:MAG: phage tail protein [Kofleriaceae bacterium]|nr:phage tail protein [Kofleriaceae bacterium]